VCVCVCVNLKDVSTKRETFTKYGVKIIRGTIVDYPVFLFVHSVKCLRAMKNEATYSSTNCRLINIL
jgi:hypothetical protein